MKLNSGSINDMQRSGGPFEFKKTYLMKPTKKNIRHLEPTMFTPGTSDYKVESNKKVEEIDLKEDF